MIFADLKNKPTFSFFGTKYRIFFDMDSYSKLLGILKKLPSSDIILGRYKNDISKLLPRDNYFIGLSTSNQRNELGFFTILDKEIFKFDPVTRICKTCGNQFYLGKARCLEVYSGIKDKLEFDKHQQKLSEKTCPVCGNNFEREFIALVIEKNPDDGASL